MDRCERLLGSSGLCTVFNEVLVLAQIQATCMKLVDINTWLNAINQSCAMILSQQSPVKTEFVFDAGAENPFEMKK